MPEVLRRPPGRSRSRWFANYVDLVVDKEVMDISRVRRRRLRRQLLRFFYTSESPMWSAAYEGLDHAAEIIKKTYYADEITVQPGQRQDQEQGRPAAVRPGAILELFKSPYGIRTLLVSILVVTQAVEFYGISLYTPKILAALLGNRIELVLLLSAVANTFGVIGAILCVMTVQRVGLRRLAVIGFAVTFCCLAVISGAYPLLAIPVATVLIWVFYAGHNFGPGYAGTAMGSLSYPTNVRGISGGYTQAITRVGGIIGAYASRSRCRPWASGLRSATSRWRRSSGCCLSC